MYFHPLCFWLRDSNIPVQLPGSIPQNQVSSITHLAKPFSKPFVDFLQELTKLLCILISFMHIHSTLLSALHLTSFRGQTSLALLSIKAHVPKIQMSQEVAFSCFAPTILSPISGESPWSLEIHCL